MHSIILKIFFTVTLLTITTVWSKNLIGSIGLNEIRNKRNTGILYPIEDSTHSESIQSSQWIKIIEKPDSESNSELQTTNNADNLETASSDLFKQEDVQQQLPSGIQNSEINHDTVKENNNQENEKEIILTDMDIGNNENQNKIQIVWLFPKRNILYIKTNDCRKSVIDVTNDENRKCNNKNNNSIFYPICGYNGEQYVTFYNYCEFETINECQDKSNNTDVNPDIKEDKWEIVSIRKCIDKYKIISLRKTNFDDDDDDDYNKENLQDNKYNMERHSELTIEDIVNEKVESFKRPDPNDPNKECGDEFRKEQEKEIKI